MARTGLRMMPTFPSPPLKFRTVGFPQSGFKAGISDAAFPANWFAIVLRALGCQRGSLLGVRDDALISTSVRAVYRSTPGALAPVRVMLSRSIFTYSAPSAPLAGTSRLHRHGLYGMPSLCVQRQRLGDQRVVPCFRWLFFIDMSSSETPGAPQLPLPSSFAANAGLRPGARVSASPTILTLRFT